MTARVGQIRRGRPPNPNLTKKETIAMWHLAEGISNKEIATRMELTEATARFHVRNAMRKLHSRTRTAAAVKFVLSRAPEALSRLAPQAAA